MDGTQLVSLIASGQTSQAMDALNSLMLDRINSRIEEVKPEIAQQHFTRAFGEE